MMKQLTGKLTKDDLGKNTQILITYGILVILVVFTSIYASNFLSVRNIKNQILAAFPLLVVASAQTLVMLSGGIDLSLGAMVALTNCTCVVLMFSNESAFSFLPSVIITLAVGGLCGLLNGLFITRGKLAPIIVTIATTAVFEGIALFLMPTPGGNVHKGFRTFMTRGLDGWFPLLLTVVIVTVVSAVANHSPFGKSLRAIGGNESAAYSTGIRINNVKMKVYIFAGLLAAIAGIFVTTEINSGDPQIGKSFSMNAVTASVVGGTAMSGAIGNPIGTLAGVFIYTIINNMLNLFGVSSFYQYIFQGSILVVALAISTKRKG